MEIDLLEVKQLQYLEMVVIWQLRSLCLEMVMEERSTEKELKVAARRPKGNRGVLF